MAVYRLKANVISRSRGQNVIACAAYRAGDKLYDERHAELHDYTRKKDVAHTEILLPKNAPKWMQDRQKLWNIVEACEKRKDSQLAREVQLTLPRELSLSQNMQLTREFVETRFVSCGMVADIAIHLPKASDGESQPHAHVLLTMRELKKNGFGLKVREWNEKCELEMWRSEWCDYQNKHLALNGHDIRVDHRSLKDQGINLIPQKKLGPTGLFDRMSAYKEHKEAMAENAKRLLEKPEIIFDVLVNQQSTFTHRDIARVVNRYTADGDQFLTLFEKAKASAELVPLGLDDKKQERFTTRGMLKLEAEMMNDAKILHKKTSHAVKENLINDTCEKYDLSSEQSAVLKYLVAPNDLQSVIGYAGTGKSRSLGAAKEVWEKSGYNVIGATLSGIAAENLQSSSNIESRTLASRLYYWDKGEQLLTAKDVLVIDEAGMIGSAQLAKIMQEANRNGAKVVLIGDPEQLQAIQAGAAFRGILDHTSHIELVEIWRQRADWQKQATIEFASNKTIEAMDRYAAHGCVHEYEHKDAAKNALVESWNEGRISQSNKTHMIFSYTREDVRDLNLMARSLRKSLGELGENHNFSTVNGEREFAEGDRIYFLKNDNSLGVKNGSIGNIINIDNDLIKVKLDTEKDACDKIVQFSINTYDQIDHGYAATIYKGQGGTYDRSYILPSKYFDRHASYVVMTRHRDEAEVFWSKDEFPSYDKMVQVLSRERLKDVSVDYPTAMDEYEKANFASRRGFDGLWESFLDKYAFPFFNKIKSGALTAFDEVKMYVEELKKHYPEQMKKLEESNHKLDELTGGFIDTREKLQEKYAARISKSKIVNLDKNQILKGPNENDSANAEQRADKSQTHKIVKKSDKEFEIGD